MQVSVQFAQSYWFRKNKNIKICQHILSSVSQILNNFYPSKVHLNFMWLGLNEKLFDTEIIIHSS